VQILGDSQGNIYHLYERDCSVQRRNQKVVERAPAPYLSDTQRERICELGRKICAHVNYECAGTVEFLMDMDSGEFYFIEVNPRVQVEHTVTEEVTGIDIVRAQILIAEGKTLTEATGCASQYDVKLDGHALQCRITTEDPQNNFIPDYGRISAYRTATGMGIRLDGGTAYAGAVITRFYDSLLVKVTAWAPTPEAALSILQKAGTSDDMAARKLGEKLPTGTAVLFESEEDEAFTPVHFRMMGWIRPKALRAQM
jgi:pyruvate carboxylase